MIYFVQGLRRKQFVCYGNDKTSEICGLITDALIWEQVAIESDDWDHGHAAMVESGNIWMTAMDEIRKCHTKPEFWN